MAMEIFRLVGSVFVDTDKAEASLQKTDKTAQGFGKTLLGGIGTAAKWAAGIVAAAGAVATGVGVAAKKAVDSYAEYEQLVGGVETLFKDSAGKVVKYAENAYMTAGLTANEYMDTVTGFSASLLQGLGGDTEKAANIADLAITDMSDNANKMGTSMSSIQNAYQGFAKANYTMLDNLKLGYGGTKEEMLRLVNDSGVLTETVSSLDDVSFDQIILAIHAVQENLGIAGATAAEATSTIEGGVKTIQAKFGNLVTRIGKSLAPVVQSVITKILDHLPQIESMVMSAIPAISAAIETAVSWVEAAVVWVDEAIAVIQQLAAEVMPVISAALETVIGWLSSLVGKLSESGATFEDIMSAVHTAFETAMSVIRGVWESIGKPVWGLIKTVVGTVADYFSDKMPEIRDFVKTTFTDIKNLWEQHLKPAFTAIGNFIQNVLAPAFKLVFNTIIGPTVSTAFHTIKQLWTGTLKPVFQGILDFITGVFSLNFKQAFSGLVTAIGGIWNGLQTVVKTPINAVIGIINGFIGGLNKLKIPDWVPGVGGKGINISTIPYLEQGAVLEKGQVGFLEGHGAEAVVPLHENKKWISAVARDMESSGAGGSGASSELLDAFEEFVAALPGLLLEAFGNMRFDINDREFARMVKRV